MKGLTRQKLDIFERSLPECLEITWVLQKMDVYTFRLAEMIFISPTNLVGEINFHLPNWNFHLPNFFLHFNKNFCVFVNYLLLAFLIFFKTSTLTVKKKLIKWLNFFPTKFSIMINHKSLTREYYWVTKSFLQNFDLYTKIFSDQINLTLPPK